MRSCENRPLWTLGGLHLWAADFWAAALRLGLETKAGLMKLEPLGDKVVVRRVEAESQTAGGIVLPDSAKERPQEGRILAIGDGRLLGDGKRMKPQVSEGDRVIFSSYAGTEVVVDDHSLLLMSEEDVLAVLE